MLLKISEFALQLTKPTLKYVSGKHGLRTALHCLLATLFSLERETANGLQVAELKTAADC